MANKLIKAVDYNEEFNIDTQKLFIDYLMSDSTAFSLCRNILSEEYFDAKLQSTVKFILEYANEHRSLPIPEIIKAKTGIQIKLTETDKNLRGYFLQELEKFCRYKALQNAIMESAKLLESGQGGEIEGLIKKAVEVSLQTDLGTNFFANPKERLKHMMENSTFISTGWLGLDDELGGGFAPGTLNVFAGASGTGKSLFLQNIALNWAFTGKNVVYISLELSELLIQQRLYAMVSNRGTKAIFKDIDETAFEIINASKNSGTIFIKRMREGSSTNDIRAYLKELEIQTGLVIHCVLLDYLELLHPNNKNFDLSNISARDKYISEEFRGMLEDEEYLSATASQMIKGVEEAGGQFSQMHVAGGITKTNTSDNMFAIHTNTTMKEAGQYELQVLKARTSDSVGHTIKFGYNNRTMRITDPVDDPTRPTSKANLKAEMKVPPKKNVSALMEEEEAPQSESVLSMMDKLMAKKKSLDKN